MFYQGGVSCFCGCPVCVTWDWDEYEAEGLALREEWVELDPAWAAWLNGDQLADEIREFENPEPPLPELDAPGIPERAMRWQRRKAVTGRYGGEKRRCYFGNPRYWERDDSRHGWGEARKIVSLLREEAR
jgi:hypothetical protein